MARANSQLTQRSSQAAQRAAATTRTGPAPRIPLSGRLLRFAFHVLGHVAPQLAGRWANYLWLRPPRYTPPAREQELLARAVCMPMTYAGKHVSVYAWGAGPTVLLVHGWSGRGAQMGAFADPLVAAGYRVIAFDAPAHGRSQGEATNLPEISALIRTLAETLGPVHAVIAHSFGVACTLLALSEGLSLTRVVAISPPDTIEGLVSKFAAGLKLPRAAVAVMRERFEAQFGRDLWTRFSPLRLAQNTKTAALIIHDDADQEVPWQEGEALARAWPGAQFLRTRGLGHRRILRDPAVTVRAARFLTLGEASPGDAG